MDKQAFKQRMQNLKSYRENNPGKGYWDWKVQAYQNGGENSNPWPNTSEQDRQYLYDKINPALGFGIFDFLGAALTYSNIANRTKASNEDENRWKAYLGLPYDKEYAPDTNIRFKGDEKYPDRQYQGLSKDAKDEIRDLLPLVRQASNHLPKGKWIQVTDEKQGDIRRSDIIEHTRQNHLGDLGKFGIRENNDSGIYEIGDKYDFPWYVPVPDRAKGTELMIRDTIWSDRANPEKYIPYRVPAHADGGEVDEFQRKTRRDIMQESLVDGRPDYNKMFQNQNEYQKDFANYWYTERAKNPKYSDQIGGDKLNSVLSNVNKATWKTPTEAMRDNMVGQGYNPTDAQINQQLNILKEKGTKGFANPKAHSYTSLRPANTWHEGIGHIVGDNTPAILNATPNVRISNPDSSYEDYVNQANEKHAQTWDFRGNNSNLKDDQGNYYIDPNRQLTPEDISNMRSKGAKIPEQWESLEDADISELTNTFAYNMYQDPVQYMANGGEVGDPDDEFTKAVNTKLGRTPDGRPLQQGLKPVFDLEDAANLTPVGDVLSAKEAYDAVKQNDWLGAGLAGLGFIPFIPKGVRRIARQTPTVNRTFEQKVAEMEKRVSNRRKMMEEFYDQRNRTYELLNTPEARRRAADIDQKYGTEYNKVYDKLTKEYEDITSYVNMVEPEFVKDPDAFARIKPAKSGKKISLSEDNITKPEDFPTGFIRHEIGHYVDEMAYPGGVPNNAYLRQLGKPSKYRPFEEVKGIFRSPDKALQDYRYLRNPTEKKSIMNQFDEYLMNNYTPSTYPQTTKEFKEAIEKAPDIHRNMKLLLKIHNKPSILFKDFKNRPLVNNTTKDKNKELI